MHYYEGYPITDVVLPARLMKMMGAKVLFLTNASGGINPAFHAGSLMLIKDHISCFAPNPLIGPNIDELGTRFPDMTHVYDEDLQEIIKNTAKENDIELFEGVYAQLTGPSFESPSEIRMLQTLGASAVGMSTVVEAIAANHMGMKICGVSCVSNLAAGMNSAPLTHEEVQEAANAVAPKFEKLLTESVKQFGKLLCILRPDRTVTPPFLDCAGSSGEGIFLCPLFGLSGGGGASDGGRTCLYGMQY